METPISSSTSVNTLVGDRNGEMEPHDSHQDSIAEFKPDTKLKLAFLALMVLTFMVAINDSALAVALPVVAKDLNGTTLEAFWAGTGFLLTEAIFLAPLGTLSHTFGRLAVLNFSTVMFLIGTIIASVSPNFPSLISGRAVQGIGAGGVIVSLEIVVTDLIPLKSRGKYFSIISALWTIGDVAGPIVGGALSYRASWRWIFWLNIPVAVVAFVMINLFLRLDTVPGTLLEKVRRADWIGTGICVSAITSLLLGITWGGVLFPWDSVTTILPIALGFIGVLLLGFYNKVIPQEEPIIRFDLLTNYNILYALFSAFFHTILALGLIYMLPLYFEAVKGFDPIQAGLALIPYGLTVAPFSAVGALVITKTRNMSWVIRCGFAIAILGTGLLVLLDVDRQLWQAVLILVVTGAGLGLLYTSLVLLAQGAIEEKHAAFAVTILNFFRHLGQAVGVAIVGVIFQNEMQTKMLGDPGLAPVASDFSQDATALIEKLRVMQDGEFKVNMIRIYAESLKTVWIVMCALCVLPFIGSFFLRGVNLERELETNQGLRREKRARSDEEGTVTEMASSRM
ncbi:putative MFS transporter [Xylariales sp. AK1849]|nr:putative MFS transporter [Xylariales sp. AK1849]